MRPRRRRQSQGKRKGQEDAKAQDNLFEFATATAQQAFPEDSVSGVAGKSRAGRVPGSHPNSGKSSCLCMIIIRDYFSYALRSFYQIVLLYGLLFRVCVKLKKPTTTKKKNRKLSLYRQLSVKRVVWVFFRSIRDRLRWGVITTYFMHFHAYVRRFGTNKQKHPPENVNPNVYRRNTCM